MKFIKSCIVGLFIIYLSSCSLVTIENNTESNSQSSTRTKAITTESEHKDESKVNDHQPLTRKVFSCASLFANEGMTINLPEVGLKKLVVRRMADGYPVTFNEYPLRAYILSDYRYGQSPMHDSYLAVEIKNKILVYDFENYSLDEFLYLCDVDGDGLDEIIVQQHCNDTGGAGQFASVVFKIIEEKICEIFNSIIINPTDNMWTVFDTGFTSEFLNGYKLKISNTITGYSRIMDISKAYTNDFFDESGKGNRNISIWCDSFFEFIPKDIDDDGIYELVGLQYVSLEGHSDGIGEAKSVLKFNAKSQKFEVIQAEFITTD